MLKMLAKLKKGYDKLMRREGKLYRVMMAASCSISLFMSQANIVLASSGVNYGETIGKFILDNLFWLGLVGLALSLFGCLLKRAWVPAIITGLAGSIILFFMKNPEKLASIGEKIANTVFS